jgi:hypothetical protein
MLLTYQNINKVLPIIKFEIHNKKKGFSNFPTIFFKTGNAYRHFSIYRKIREKLEPLLKKLPRNLKISINKIVELFCLAQDILCFTKEIYVIVRQGWTIIKLDAVKTVKILKKTLIFKRYELIQKYTILPILHKFVDNLITGVAKLLYYLGLATIIIV